MSAAFCVWRDGARFNRKTGFLALLLLAFAHLVPLSALAQPTAGLRIATWNPGMKRAGPGLLLRDLAGGRDPALEAGLRVMVALDADVLLLTAVDYDHGMVLAQLLAARLAEQGADYPELLALRPNSGWATGLDLDGDGRLGGAADAQGWGSFAGQGGLLLLSRLAIDRAEIRDFSPFLWRDLPGQLMPATTPPDVQAVQRLASTGFWEVPLILAGAAGQPGLAGPADQPGAARLRLLAFHATPPVFDGAEDRNGRRNHDEAAFWLQLLAGALPLPPPSPPFVLLGDANMDPLDGDGRPDAVRALLAHPALQDPKPQRSAARKQEPGHQGDPRQDTAIYAGIGGLRVDLLLPGADLVVLAAGVMDAADDPALAADLLAASRHLPVWVDLADPRR